MSAIYIAHNFDARLMLRESAVPYLEARGKWFEFGYARRAGKRIILIGKDKGCVFVRLPGLTHTSSLAEAEKYL